MILPESIARFQEDFDEQLNGDALPICFPDIFAHFPEELAAAQDIWTQQQIERCKTETNLERLYARLLNIEQVMYIRGFDPTNDAVWQEYGVIGGLREIEELIQKQVDIKFSGSGSDTTQIPAERQLVQLMSRFQQVLEGNLGISMNYKVGSDRRKGHQSRLTIAAGQNGTGKTLVSHTYVFWPKLCVHPKELQLSIDIVMARGTGINAKQNPYNQHRVRLTPDGTVPPRILTEIVHDIAGKLGIEGGALESFLLEGRSITHENSVRQGLAHSSLA